MAMVLHPTLGDILDDFLHCEMTRVCHQAAELAAAMTLHQARMKDVCHSIKAHDHWVKYREHFPEFDLQCRYCGDIISPEFDRGRHKGLCYLREWLAVAHRYPLDEIWV